MPRDKFEEYAIDAITESVAILAERFRMSRKEIAFVVDKLMDVLADIQRNREARASKEVH